ncbi:MAG TPA: FtsX-like permease family protein [Candidatus Polarisedimenticolaceae bacterium]|nr:FtsX-like permease family protein [Candidatus Polarisedimenticolaceae bacterium]
MQIGPIFRAMFRHKGRFWLIAVEVALTLAIISNCLNMVLVERQKMNRPTGIDEDNILVVYSEPFDKAFEDKIYARASYDNDLRALRGMPGVHAAAGMHAIPLSGGGSATGRRPRGSEIDTLSAPYFIVSEGVIAALGVELVEGRDFTAADFPTPDDDEASATAEDEAAAEPDLSNVIVTREFAELMYPDGDALGKTIENRNGDSIDTIIGVIERMHNSWPLASFAERVVLYPGEPWSERGARYVVRAEPGMLGELYTTIEDELIRQDEGRLIRVETLAEVKGDTYSGTHAVTKMLGGLSVLLILVTSLGIIGLTSFSVTQRTREIGTRRALGATRTSILGYFLVENWIVTGVGLVVGVGLTYGLNFVLAQWAEVQRIEIPQVAVGVLTIWLAGLAAALAPAIRGTTVQPVTATRNV